MTMAMAMGMAMAMVMAMVMVVASVRSPRHHHTAALTHRRTDVPNAHLLLRGALCLV